MALRHNIKNLAGLTQKDFFGIYDITSKDISAAFSNLNKLAPQEHSTKYEPLRQSRTKLVNEDREQTAHFGAIRYDTDNPVKKHGQYEADNVVAAYTTVEMKQMFVPDLERTADKESPSNATISQGLPEESPQIGNKPYKISEVQAVKDLSEVFELFKSPNDKAKKALRYARKPPLTFYFDQAVRSAHEEPQPHSNLQGKVNIILDKPGRDHQSKKQKPTLDSRASDIRRPQMDLDAQAGPDGVIPSLDELDPMSQEYIEREYEETKAGKFDRKVDQQFDVHPEPVKPVKASDYLKEVRAQKIKPIDKGLENQLDIAVTAQLFEPSIRLDSKGFNNYKYQVPDWSLIRRVDAIEYIRKSIAYHNYDILAINKPYGISSHRNSSEPNHFNMDSLVSELAKQMRIKKVHLAHRLDKNTTGLLLFATSESRARDLNNKFKNGDIKKTYLCITKGIPSPPMGIIDMPIASHENAGKFKSVPVPEMLDSSKQLAQHYQEARRAVTEYQVVKHSKHMALVECKPTTGVKHQIRCHMGFGLNTPILGDHKYSNLNKMAPQQLPSSALAALRIRQSKVRTIPIHLHAKNIVIPAAKANGEPLHIDANLPQHFLDNLKALKLN